MNFLYIYRQSEKYDPVNLRYSLRSLEKWCDSIGEIVISGDALPHELQSQNRLHSVKCDRKSTRYADAIQNLEAGIEKALRLCVNNNISEREWMIMHDDYFLLSPPRLWLQYEGYLTDRMKRTDGERKELFENTMNFLKTSGYESQQNPFNYCLHVPLPIDVFRMYYLTQVFRGKVFSYSSAYGNADNYLPKMSATDVKFNAKTLKLEDLEDLRSFSTYNENDHFISILNKLYPKKSRYEL